MSWLGKCGVTGGSSQESKVAPAPVLAAITPGVKTKAAALEDMQQQSAFKTVTSDASPTSSPNGQARGHRLGKAHKGDTDHTVIQPPLLLSSFGVGGQEDAHRASQMQYSEEGEEAFGPLVDDDYADPRAGYEEGGAKASSDDEYLDEVGVHLCTNAKLPCLVPLEHSQ